MKRTRSVFALRRTNLYDFVALTHLLHISFYTRNILHIIKCLLKEF